MDAKKFGPMSISSITLAMQLVIAARCFFDIHFFRNLKFSAEVFLYANIILAAAAVTLVIAALTGFIKNFHRMTKSEKYTVIAAIILLLAFCPFKTGLMSFQDLTHGPEKICSEYYTIGKKLYIYDENTDEDFCPIINRKQRSYISENASEINQQRTLNTLDRATIIAHRDPLCITYYPNTTLVAQADYPAAE